jgi:GH25 family lysozyme M1 (1,4-beta-N-acetylmuramidase)
MTVNGIDVSAWQGQYDWKTHPGIAFAGIRATNWTAPATFDADPDLKWNAEQTWDLHEGKIPRLYYHYARPGLHHPWHQAEAFLDTLGHHLCEGDVLVDDMEDAQGEPPAFVAHWHAEFMQHLNDQAPGHRVLGYCNPSWASAGNCAGLDRWHLYLADYGVTRPVTPLPWRTWAFWQFSDVPEDQDRWNGDLAGLLDFCRMPASRR